MLYLDSLDFSLFDTLHSAVHRAQRMSDGKNVAVTLSIDDRVPSIVVGDPAWLRQIFLHFLSNAVQSTDRGSVTFTARLLEESVHMVRIEFVISDTGSGIPAEQRASIVKDPAIPDEGLDVHSGTFDLNTVKKLIDLHGGSLQIERTTEKGSIFKIQLLFGRSEKTSLDGHSFPTTGSLNSLNGIRVLIVDDNELNLEVAMRTLKQWDIEVDVADSGAAALAKLEKSSFDLILMDLQMPEMDGFETTRHIRSQFSPPLSQIPIIAVTAFVTNEAEDRSFAAGMNGYLPKPIEPAALHATIVRLLNLDFSPTTQAASADVTQNVHPAGRISNLSYIESISNGDQTFVLKMVEIYLEQTELFLRQLLEAYEQKDWDVIRHIAHKIKPSLRMIGLSDIGSILNTIEQSTEEMKDLEQLPALIPQVERACRQSMIELEHDRERLKGLELRG
jgi:CheY-like chemotaxis protein